jgi:hypothetical protein
MMTPLFGTPGKEMTPMKRYVMVLMALALLSLPPLAAADDQTIPPEANWTPTPPASPKVDAKELVEVLVRKGLLTPVDQSQLTQSPVAIPSKDYREKDYRGMDLKDGGD